MQVVSAVVQRQQSIVERRIAQRGVKIDDGGYITPGFAEISVSRDRIVFPLGERTGNIWMAEWKP